MSNGYQHRAACGRTHSAAGCATVLIGGMPAARVGDMLTCTVRPCNYCRFNHCVYRWDARSKNGR